MSLKWTKFQKLIPFKAWARSASWTILYQVTGWWFLCTVVLSLCWGISLPGWQKKKNTHTSVWMCLCYMQSESRQFTCPLVFPAYYPVCISPGRSGVRKTRQTKNSTDYYRPLLCCRETNLRILRVSSNRLKI